MSPDLTALIFSRDRAMQLDALLRSFYHYAADAGACDVTVIYRAEAGQHARQYAQLIAEYAHLPRLRFVAQGRFRQDVLAGLAAGAQLSGGAPALKLYRAWAALHRRLGFIAAPLLRMARPAHGLFLVDDNLFVRHFRLQDAVLALHERPQALGFSLRLGRNTQYCYTQDRPQALPAFTPAGGDVLAFDWTQAELDFNYPLEVSSSIYRLSDVLPLLNRQPFVNPNQLESRLAQSAPRFSHRPQMLCYQQSVTFCNPINKVQTSYQNRAGMAIAYTSADLAGRFDAGERIDLDPLDGFTSTGCHQEVAFSFILPDRSTIRPDRSSIRP